MKDLIEETRRFPRDSFDAQERISEIAAYFDCDMAVSEIAEMFGLNPIPTSLLLNNFGTALSQ